jgi:nucleoside-diphosphate-sugar epimerase
MSDQNSGVERPLKVLVTGAGGYIGRHVVNALLEFGAEVVALDRGRGADSKVDPRAQVIIGDVLGPDTLGWEALGQPDVCIHLAWEAGFDHGNPIHLSRLSAHYDFLKGLLDDGLPQLVGLGTMHEIGYFEGEIGEDTPAAPQSLYGIAKHALHRALEIEAQRTGAVFQWLRCFYIYGDDRGSKSIFNKILLAAEAGLESFPMNTGESQYDFIHVQELGRQIAATAMQTAVVGTVHCGSGHPRTLREQVEMFVSENGLDITLEYGRFPARAYDSPASWGNSEKISQIMGARN